MSTCSFEGCDKPIMGKGLCAGHYHQQRRGQELRPLRKRTSPKETSTCSFEGCDNPINAKGLCSSHYRQLRRGEELRPLRKRTSPKATERLRPYGLRKCAECGQVKPLEEFAKDKRSKDGRAPRCRACHAEYIRQWRRANRERVREYSRRYYEANREKMITCSFEGCDNPINAKGLCSSHYEQLRRGEELRPLRKRTSPKEAERLRPYGLRKCTECGQVKPLEEFAKDRHNSDGRASWCKACRAEYSRQWRGANREKRLEYARRYREANRERIREYERQWREANRERVREYARQWRQKNPDKGCAP